MRINVPDKSFAFTCDINKSMEVKVLTVEAETAYQFYFEAHSPMFLAKIDAGCIVADKQYFLKQAYIKFAHF